MHYKVLPNKWLLHVVSHLLNCNHCQIPCTSYSRYTTSLFDSPGNPFCKIHIATPAFISKLKPWVPTMSCSLFPDFPFYHDATSDSFTIIKNCDGDSKYGLGQMQVRTLVASAWNSTNWVSQQFAVVSFWHHIQQRKSMQDKLCFDENTFWKWAWLHIVYFGAMYITKQSVLLFLNNFSQGRSQRTTKLPCSSA